MRAIFIQGISRAGSKFYMQLLNTHPQIFITPEIMFRHPIKHSFSVVVKNALERGCSVEELVQRLFEFRERVPFTKTIEKIGKARLINTLSSLSELSEDSVFYAIIRLSAEAEGKQICGAKFSVHHSETARLLTVFDGAKILYLIRDPRGVFVSDFLKKERESRGVYYRFPIRGTFLRLAVLIYTVAEWRMSISSYERCVKEGNGKRIRLFRYEDLISDQVKLVESVSDFLGIRSREFAPEMIKVADSSFDGGVSSTRWQKEIFPHEKFLIKLLLKPIMSKYGYR